MLFFIRDLKLDSGGPGEGSLSTGRRSGSEPRDDEVADRARLDGRSPSGREAVFVGTSRVEFWVSDKKKHQGWASETSYLSIYGIYGAVGAIPRPLEPLRNKKQSHVTYVSSGVHSNMPRTIYIKGSSATPVKSLLRRSCSGHNSFDFSSESLNIVHDWTSGEGPRQFG